MLPPPIFPPEEVAYAILRCAVKPRLELVVGGVFRRMLPGLYDLIGPALTFFERRGIAPLNTQGALHAPQRSAKVRGEQPGYVMRTSLYTRALLIPAPTLAFVAVGLGAIAGVASLRAWSERY